MRRALALGIALALASCSGAEEVNPPGLQFRAQCFKDAPGAIAATVQGIPAWFGTPRTFPITAYHPVNDGQGHPAIQVSIEGTAHAKFEAFTLAGVSGPVGLFLDGELIAVPSIQTITDGRFTFCNEAGGWTPTDRDRWIERLRASQGD